MGTTGTSLASRDCVVNAYSLVKHQEKQQDKIFSQKCSGLEIRVSANILMYICGLSF